MFLFLNKLFIYLVTMDHFCKSNAKTNLATLHYVTFIEPLAVFPAEALSFDSEKFTNNSINEVIEAKTNDPFLLLEEHFFDAILLYKKIMKFNSKKCSMKF
jgi:hypothetical protein